MLSSIEFEIVGRRPAQADSPHIHAVMNTAVYAPVVVVFVCSGMYKQFGFGRGEPEPAPQN